MKSCWNASVFYHKDGEQENGPSSGYIPQYTALILADTLPEAISIVWRELTKKLDLEYLQEVETARENNVFPPDKRQTFIDAIKVERTGVPVVE